MGALRSGAAGLTARAPPPTNQWVEQVEGWTVFTRVNPSCSGWLLLVALADPAAGVLVDWLRRPFSLLFAAPFEFLVYGPGGA